MNVGLGTEPAKLGPAWFRPLRGRGRPASSSQTADRPG